MPVAQDLPTYVEVLLIAGASAGAVTAILVLIAQLWRKLMQPIWKRINAMHEVIDRELTPNGGSSMKDVIHQVMTFLVAHEAKHDEIVERLARVEQATQAKALDPPL